MPLASYTQTADDIGPTTKLGIYGSTNPNPFHQYIEWNVVYNNHMAGCGAGGSTDGNGIILDTLDNSNTGVNYPNRSLVAFNVVYNNGGAGLIEDLTSNATFANNTCYNNDLDTDNSATVKGCIYVNRYGDTYWPGNNVLVNNLAYQYVVGPGGGPVVIGGTGGETATDAFYNGGSCGLTVDGVADCGGNNITYLPGGAVPENPNYNLNPTWSCTANKCMTNPLWIGVGGTAGNTGSSGSMSTPPAGTNFGLQSASSAIGYGQTRPYLPAQSVDAGACYHTLTSCP